MSSKRSRDTREVTHRDSHNTRSIEFSQNSRDSRDSTRDSRDSTRDTRDSTRDTSSSSSSHDTKDIRMGDRIIPQNDRERELVRRLQSNSGMRTQERDRNKILLEKISELNNSLGSAVKIITDERSALENMTRRADMLQMENNMLKMRYVPNSVYINPAHINPTHINPVHIKNAATQFLDTLSNQANSH